MQPVSRSAADDLVSYILKILPLQNNWNRSQLEEYDYYVPCADLTFTLIISFHCNFDVFSWSLFL